MEISNINDEEDIKNESENISLNEFNNKFNKKLIVVSIEK